MLRLLGKWRLHRFYQKHPQIRNFLPPTELLTKSSLTSYLNRYGEVFIKSTTVHTGKRVMKAWKDGSGYKLVKVKGTAYKCPNVDVLYNKVMEGDRNHVYIVQKAIDLALIRGRPYDIRVMMMRDGQLKWQYAGMIAKVAGPTSVITNVQRGKGYALDIESALMKSLGCSKEKAGNLINALRRLSSTIMNYSNNYPFYSYQCGIDLAVDKRGKIWIIEVNLDNPSHSLFNKIPDKTFFRRIKRLAYLYYNRKKRGMTS